MSVTSDDLEGRRYERLVEQLVAQLPVRRTIVLDVESVEDVETWRKAARAAGRRLRLPIRTGISSDGSRLWISEGP